MIVDPVVVSNKAKTIAYATAGPNTRTTQLFINYIDNKRLDSLGFSPFGKKKRFLVRKKNLIEIYFRNCDNRI